jgi:hypothetical protein
MKLQLRQIIGPLIVVYITCMAASAKADWSYDFASTLPASFVLNPIGPPTGTLSAGIDAGQLRLTDPQVYGGGPPLRGFAADSSQVFGDVRVSAIVNAAGNSDDLLGLNVRGPHVFEQCCGSAYAANLDFSRGDLEVVKLVATSTIPPYITPVITRSNWPEQGSQPLLTDLDRSYFLEFTVIGNVLDARVFDQPGGAELLHVHYVDDQGRGGPSLAPGSAGVVAFRHTGSLDATFDNLSVTAIPEPGDYNQNGVVDTADYVVWRSGLGTTYTQTDYDVWRAHFGQSVGNGAAGYPLGASAEPLSAAVPEPSSWVLFCLGMIAAAIRRTI